MEVRTAVARAAALAAARAMEAWAAVRVVKVRAAVARAAATGVSGRGNLAEAAPDNDRYITDNRRSRKLFVAQLIINQLF